MSQVVIFRQPDHPRGCGENSYVSDRRQRRIGSPPRMRGKLFSYCSHKSPKGITPADAGKTSLRGVILCGAKDHPRGCGENRGSIPPDGGGSGSPPRMRGKPQHKKSRIATSRITPADAGKTKAAKSICAVAKDHPRGCGENMYTTRTAPGFLGSPPRMRGKRCSQATKATHQRITPADAGKTSSGSFFCPRYWDHPRGCGENFAAFLSAARILGSPPRMRGKLNCRVTSSTRVRITPADAGKTTQCCGYRSTRQDHPRGCGENLPDFKFSGDVKGSPPRMRGKRQ